MFCLGLDYALAVELFAGGDDLFVKLFCFALICLGRIGNGQNNIS